MLPPTYARMKAEGDGTSYPGCSTPLAFASLRLTARASLRLALALPPTYACPKAEGDGTRYPGWMASLGLRLRFIKRTPA